jgi:Telomere resolvase
MARATVANEPSKWLVKSWSGLFERLAACQSESDVERECSAELEAWRARPTIKSEQSLKRHITDSQAEIKRRASAGELNEQLAAWALKYLNFSGEKWDEINASTIQRAQERQEHQQFLSAAAVDGIVSTLTFLLESSHPIDIAVALAGNVGARTLEVLQTMELEQVSGYSVMFWGQAKKGEREFPGYEKHTLSPAGAVIRGLARLRSLLPTQQMSPRSINRKFGPMLKEATNKHFADLIPAPVGKDDLFVHLFRSVYARIATYWYCPNEVTDLSFFSAICGHFELIGETEEQRRIFADSQSYVRYQILTLNNEIDGRHGVRRGEKGVETLRVFQQKPEEAEETTPKKEKDHTIVRLRPATARSLKMEAVRRAIEGKYWEDATINAMLSDPSGGRLAPEQLVPGDIALAVREALGGDGDFQAFLETALRKEARFQRGVETRYEKLDVASISTSKLAGIRQMDAANERYRRAVAAIAAHNDKVSSPNDRWFINTTSVHNLVGGKFTLISAYLASRQAEIDALNLKHGLTQLSNRKQAKINELAAGPAQVIVPE